MTFKKKFFGFTLFFLITQNIFSVSLYKSGVTASYYAEAFHGKKTSNGEIFNMNALTCAHKMLPFNTVLRVTNLSNGKQVDVRVNDRGPFVAGREIDLSKAAAIRLGMIGKGTVKVKLEIVKLGPNTKASQTTAIKASQMMANLEGKSVSKKTDSASLKPVVKRAEGTLWDIQLGAFASRENANKKAQALLKAGFKNVVFQTVKSSGIVRVVIRQVDAKDMPSMEKQLRTKGFTEYTVKQRK